jgi:hypothetical protein
MFSYPTENPFGEDIAKAYEAIQPSIVARMNSDGVVRLLARSRKMA